MFSHCIPHEWIHCKLVRDPTPVSRCLFFGFGCGRCKRSVFGVGVIVGYRFLRFLDVEGKEIPGMVVMVHVKKIY